MFGWCKEPPRPKALAGLAPVVCHAARERKSGADKQLDSLMLAQAQAE